MQFNISIADYFSEKELNDLAKTTGFVERKSDITGFNFLLTFTTGLINIPESTLAQLAGFLNSNCSLNITPQAIDERINEKAKEFLKVCLSNVLNLTMQKLSFDNDLIDRFSHIYIIDSTSFELHPSLKEIFKGSSGSASASSMRIQFIYDYLSGKTYIEIGDNRTSDAPTLFDIVNENKLNTNGNVLFLQDLGYFKTETFSKIDTADNYFISKLKYDLKVYNLDGKEINLLAMLEKQPQIIDLQIKIGGLTCRLVGSKLPEKTVNERRRKANQGAKRRGRGLISKEYKLFLSYGLFITNLSEQYSQNTIYTIYRLRWQIELVFKSWKSILKINKLHSARENRILCEIYGKLIMAIVLCRFFYSLKYFTKINFSYFKMLKYFQSIAGAWTLNIIKGIKTHSLFLKDLINQLSRICKKHKQKNKPIIEDLFLLLQPTEFYVTRLA